MSMVCSNFILMEDIACLLSTHLIDEFIENVGFHRMNRPVECPDHRVESPHHRYASHFQISKAQEMLTRYFLGRVLFIEFRYAFHFQISKAQDMLTRYFLGQSSFHRIPGINKHSKCSNPYSSRFWIVCFPFSDLESARDADKVFSGQSSFHRIPVLTNIRNAVILIRAGLDRAFVKELRRGSPSHLTSLYPRSRVPFHHRPIR
ncbi:hypothetical protein CEXT_31321 [Caerostris extrusa]|uniref:Maturase K n=1 Tax=Caerostris extrusa TaxID=172846 RepID=A0AAV4MXX1_CAEEX|nr:hypothetical protein CEXT_31321 [Caerostris extrusa]